MSPVRYLALTVIVALFIAEVTSAATVKEVKGELGGEVSFGLDTIVPSVKSIIWKQKTSTETVKAIEWDDDGFSAPNPKFSGITSLDKETGIITIKTLKPEHTGLYTIDVNSKEQEQKFNLIVMEPVPTPEIKIEPIDGNPNTVYLRCEYSEKITWNNSAGESLNGSPITPKGQSLTVTNDGNKEKSYTCTLKNDVSVKTSKPVYQRDMFNDESSVGPWWISLIFLVPAALFGAFVALYKSKCEPFHDSTHERFKDKPCIGGFLSCLDGKGDAGRKDVESKDTESPKPDDVLLKPDGVGAGKTESV